MSQEITLFLVIVVGIVVGMSAYSLIASFIPGAITQ